MAHAVAGPCVSIMARSVLRKTIPQFEKRLLNLRLPFNSIVCPCPASAQTNASGITSYVSGETSLQFSKGYRKANHQDYKACGYRVFAVGNRRIIIIKIACFIVVPVAAEEFHEVQGNFSAELSKSLVDIRKSKIQEGIQVENGCTRLD